MERRIQGLFAGESSVDHVFLPAGELRPDSADLLTGDIGGMRSVLNVRLLGVAHVVPAAKPLMKGGSIVAALASIGRAAHWKRGN